MAALAACLAYASVGWSAEDSTAAAAVNVELMQKISALEAGKPLRLRLISSEEMWGIFAGRKGDTLLLTDSAGTNGIPAASVETMWKRGRATKWGIVLGGIFGAVIGTGVGGIIAGFEASMDDIPGSDPNENTIVAGSAIGLVTGALIGAGVGAFFPQWNKVYKLPDTDDDEIDKRYRH